MAGLSSVFCEDLICTLVQFYRNRFLITIVWSIFFQDYIGALPCFLHAVYRVAMQLRTRAWIISFNQSNQFIATFFSLLNHESLINETVNIEPRNAFLYRNFWFLLVDMKLNSYGVNVNHQVPFSSPFILFIYNWASKEREKRDLRRVGRRQKYLYTINVFHTYGISCKRKKQ